MSVLVIAPHADDEVLGCGGTIARRVAEGRDVHVVVVGIGPVQRPDGSLKVSADTRRAELAESCRRLGVASHSVLFDGLENRLDTLPRLDLVSRFDRLLEQQPWDEVFVPGNACHQDHAVVHAAALAALRQRPGRRRERVCALYEYPLATWSSGPDDAGAWYVALGPHLDTKMHALEAYASQRLPDSEPLSPAGVRRLAALRGTEVGVESAERFRIVRQFERGRMCWRRCQTPCTSIRHDRFRRIECVRRARPSAFLSRHLVAPKRCLTPLSAVHSLRSA